MDNIEFLLNCLDVEAFTGGTKKRNYIEGFAVADAKHLMYVGITKIQDKNAQIEIMALCLRSTDLNSSILEINLKIVYTDKKKSIKCSCTCPAGIGGQCKHATALLIHLTR